MTVKVLDRWPLFAFAASAAALAIAHASETFGHLAPCELCLKQREVYWIALALAAVGLAGAFSPWPGRARRIACVALAIIFLWGAGLAGYHAGVEWKWWPGPATCSGQAQVSSAALAALLKGGKLAAPSCDRPAIVVLGLSMAGWNALASLVLAAFSLAAAARRGSPP